MSEYPSVAFYFTASVTGLSDTNDISFEEISGITMEMGAAEVPVAGEDGFKRKLPLPIKYENLVLKRGTAPKTSPIIEWCKQTLESDFTNRIQPNDIKVTLLGSAGNVLMTWNFKNAYPVKYSFGIFNLQANSVAVEMMEFAYQYFTRTDG